MELCQSCRVRGWNFRLFAIAKRDPFEAGRKCVGVGKLGGYTNPRSKDERALLRWAICISLTSTCALNSQLGWTRSVNVVQRHGRAAVDVWRINKYRRESEWQSQRNCSAVAPGQVGVIAILIYVRTNYCGILTSSSTRNNLRELNVKKCGIIQRIFRIEEGGINYGRNYATCRSPVLYQN